MLYVLKINEWFKNTMNKYICIYIYIYIYILYEINYTRCICIYTQSVSVGNINISEVIVSIISCNIFPSTLQLIIVPFLSHNMFSPYTAIITCL
jgi:hypothetical protein